MFTGVDDIKTVVGIFFIVYGLVFTLIEQLKGPFLYIDQINGVINGFVCILVGVIVFSNSISQGLVVGLISLALWAIVKFIVPKFFKKKDKI